MNQTLFDSLPKQDRPRLSRQLEAVRQIMEGGRWLTIDRVRTELQQRHKINASAAGVSARIRDLRKPEGGGRTVERRRVPDGNGLHEYRLAPEGGHRW